MASDKMKPESTRLKLPRVSLESGGGILVALLILMMVLSLASPKFLTYNNLVIVARQSVFIMIIGLGMTFVIAMGGIDLSVGAILSLCGVVMARMMLDGQNVWLAMACGLLLGIGLGVINGILIAVLKFPDFIATLGTLSIIRGIVMVFTHGVPFFGLRIPTFQFFAQSWLGPLPVPVIITAILCVIMWILLQRTQFGRHVVAIGSNQEAARLVGIRIPRIKILVYALSGLMAAISGLLLTSRLEAAMPEAGAGYELQVIAAVVIGGTSLSGGKGHIFGTVFGALVMTVVLNGLNLLRIDVFWHQVVIGSIILIAVGIDRFSQRRAGRL